MKKSIASAAALLMLALGTWAQTEDSASYTQKWEHNIYVASGVMFDSWDGRLETGFTAKLGYGISHRLAARWSLMPGVDYRIEGTNLFLNAKDGADDDIFQYIDVPIAVRYHADGNLVLGLAPVLSFCIDRGTWYIDADPSDPLNGRSKIKMFNVGLQPSIVYQWKRMNLGLEANIGLLDVKETHGLWPYDGKRRFSNVMARLGVRF